MTAPAAVHVRCALACMEREWTAAADLHLSIAADTHPPARRALAMLRAGRVQDAVGQLTGEQP